jgi:hypothetical protein
MNIKRLIALFPILYLLRCGGNRHRGKVFAGPRLGAIPWPLLQHLSKQ